MYCMDEISNFTIFPYHSSLLSQDFNTPHLHVSLTAQVQAPLLMGIRVVLRGKKGERELYGGVGFPRKIERGNSEIKAWDYRKPTSSSPNLSQGYPLSRVTF